MGEATAGFGAPGEAIRPQFKPGRISLVWLAIRLSVLTILTFGLYRFWMATNLRRYYWSAITILGDPLEYTGTALEKLLGFLFALVILAVYLSLVNLGLAFVGLVSFDEPTGIEVQIILNLSILATLPLIFFATYRARRYILARTRWRGIRFGMDQAAWAYTLHALPLVLLSGVSLGLLYPLQNFRLTKFKIDRTWFGDAPFHQGGRWTALMRYWAWVWGLGLGLIAGLVFLLAQTGEQNLLAAGVFAMLGGLALAGMFVWYRVAAFRYFWSRRSVRGTHFQCDLSAAEIIGIYFAGYIAVGFFAVVMAAVLTTLVATLWLMFAPIEQADALWRLTEGHVDQNLAWPIFLLLAIAYLAAIAFSSALSHVFITRPILRRQAEAMTIEASAELSAVRQRAHDNAIEAGGFADALGVDVGAGV